MPTLITHADLCKDSRAPNQYFAKKKCVRLLTVSSQKEKNKIEPEQLSSHSWNANLSYIQDLSTMSQTLPKNLGN